MKLDAIREAESRLLLPTYDRNPLLFERGEGMYLIDEQGGRYLDLLSGIGVNALGHAHPVIVEPSSTPPTSTSTRARPRSPSG